MRAYLADKEPPGDHQYGCGPGDDPLSPAGTGAAAAGYPHRRDIGRKRPAAAWGFTALDHRHIICQVTARRWEIIEAATLETKEAISDLDFKGGNICFCVNKIELRPGGIIRVGGFINVWDETVTPHRELPNINLEHEVESAYLKKLYRT